MPKIISKRCELVKLCHIVLTLCLPCVALPWGQPAWQGLGFSGLVHEETHPCGSNFIQSVFKTVQTSVLIQIVPFVNNTIWKKYFLTSILNLTLHIFLHLMQFHYSHNLHHHLQQEQQLQLWQRMTRHLNTEQRRYEAIFAQLVAPTAAWIIVGEILLP